MSEMSDISGATITIESAGLLSTLQDRGRFGLRHLGVPWSGSLVPAWQQLANALVGNSPDDCILESFEGGLRLSTGDSAVRMAVMAAPDMKMLQRHGDSQSTIQPCRSYTLAPETTIILHSTGSFRHVVMAFSGLITSEQLGSASTYVKAGLGGLHGNALTAGDQLTVSVATPRLESECRDPLLEDYRSSRLRVVPGPQNDHFSADGIKTFLNSEFQLSSEVDRMGARLTGPALEHASTAARDIVSDAIVPGSIQVPGNGQPIVLLNDAHTAGGYPKIATVISIDLPLLGLQRPGSALHFEAVTVSAAIDAVRSQAATLQKAIDSIAPIRDVSLDTATLLAHNLIDGVTDGLSL
ncbi:biotin-dependent carboxyltransferase family protein [Granulosicoccus sp. 3-233]|uniref:5-oxoprolinase subunit C family protein n=1 Tax=Granulosicoccus sp. 3-233 TaxID=3417969 RepID=UPI003D3343B0